jgi:CRISPR-associated endonuclease/helicase Cas3
MPPYYAHSGTQANFSDWQLLKDHLRCVAELARGFAAAAQPDHAALADAAYVAGLLHDLGKYRKGFQDYIRMLPVPRDDRLHKQAGAAKAAAEKHIPVAFAVYGHHGGMPDKADLEIGIKAPSGAAVVQAVWETAVADSPALVTLPWALPQFRDALDADLLIRVLFGCLVDADWSDTDRFYHGGAEAPPPLDAASHLTKVLAHIAEKATACPEPRIKRVRAAILDACLAAADQPPGVFSLTVPTGGGKTLAGLAFALKHAAAHDLRRVIYVAPYMTILEQNADVFRAALGVGPDAAEVFEHYSLADPVGGDLAEETDLEAAIRRAENWDAPVIITTNVQFFESLFGNNPGRCRKLHNIARSVIILDECQTLPPGLVAPTCGMLKQLTTNLGCTVVLCTATQPAFDHDSLKPDERLPAAEIIPAEMQQQDEHDLFGRLKRVHVSWPKAGEVLDWPAVATAMRTELSALCVVNTKKAARAVYDELVKGGSDGVYHLSTAMCPQHRREKLAAIRRRLDTKLPCFLVSTQLIEAGVDVDFPFVMRELAPLESVIQATGRCNREGRLKDEMGNPRFGRVVVFRSVEGTMPPDRWYNAGRSTLETSFLARGVEPSIDDPSVINDYFARLYHTGDLDGPGIQAMRQKFQFASVAATYRLIDDPGQPVVVATWQPHQSEIESLIAELAIRPRKPLFRKLAPFQVNLLPHQWLESAHLIEERPHRLLAWRGKYHKEVGVVGEMLDDVLVV